jgi:hypothetical protein
MAGTDFNAESVSLENLDRIAMCQSPASVLALMRVTLLEVEEMKNRACSVAIAGQIVAGRGDERLTELALFDVIVDATSDARLTGLLRAGFPCGDF